MADNPGIKFPPPLVYLGFFVEAALLRFLFPILPFPAGLRFTLSPCFAAGGLICIGFAFNEFRNHKTSIFPHHSASALIENGIFRYTRNPIYLGMALLYLGAIFFLGTLWGLVLFPILLLYVDRKIIRKEEAYLERRFGTEYQDYKSRVRRWV